MEIVRMMPFVEPETVWEIAEAYRLTFGGEPWNEGYKCPVCESVLPLAMNARTCPACEAKGKQVLLAEHWPIGKIISDFYGEMSRAGAVCFIARAEGALVGFAWGYEMDVLPETDVHLEAPGLYRLLRGQFFYLDEVAVLPALQGRGIGKDLVRNIVLSQDQPNIILRTLYGSQMFHLARHMRGETILHISRQRVIMTIAP